MGSLLVHCSTSLSIHGGEGAEKQMFQAIANIKSVCEKAGVPMPTAALSWVMEQDPVCAAIVGAQSPEQVARNVDRVTLQQVSPNNIKIVPSICAVHVYPLLLIDTA